jgi:Putative prokaryotic signal transducing protein
MANASGNIHRQMQSEESLELVFETMNATEVAIIKSLLEAVGIPYLTRGEDQYDAFRGAFRGTVFNPLGRPVAFMVPDSMAEEARLLLQGDFQEEGT